MEHHVPVSDGPTSHAVCEIPLAGPSPVAAGSRAAASGPFLAGPENTLVRALLDVVLAERGEELSVAPTFPLVLHGPSSVGKSHLALGLVAAWKAKYDTDPRPNAPIYRTATDFAREFAEAIETGTLDAFHTRFRETALLVLDDLEKIEKKVAVQEDLALTADALRQRGGWLVVTTRRPPRELGRFAPRLLARLVGGLDIPVAIPGAAVRQVLLERAAKAQGLKLAVGAAAAMAENLELAAPALAGVLGRLKLEAKRTQAAVDVGSVHHVIREYREKRSPLPAEILRAVAGRFSVRVGDLKGKSRRRPTVVARAAAMYLLRNMTSMSLSQIGAVLGGKDHRTVSHAVEATEKRLQTDAHIQNTIRELERELSGA